MGYLIMAAIFVATGIGVAIWIYRILSAKAELERELSLVIKQRDENFSIAESNKAAVSQLVEERQRLEAVIEQLKSGFSATVNKLLEYVGINGIRDILKDSMGSGEL